MEVILDILLGLLLVCCGWKLCGHYKNREVDCWKETAGIEAAFAEEQIQEVKRLQRHVRELWKPAKNQPCLVLWQGVALISADPMKSYM